MNRKRKSILRKLLLYQDGLYLTEKSLLKPPVNCPYLEITSEAVVCKATDWGHGLTGVQQYGPLPRTIIVQCSSASHVKCHAYVKAKALVASSEELKVS